MHAYLTILYTWLLFHLKNAADLAAAPIMNGWQLHHHNNKRPVVHNQRQTRTYRDGTELDLSTNGPMLMNIVLDDSSFRLSSRCPSDPI